MDIPFNHPYHTGREFDYIREALDARHISGNGPFTKKSQRWLEDHFGCEKALLTHSCTGALEMAAILAGIEPGDEVIMPSYTFVSTANAFVLRGATPVFVDIRPDTLNLDEEKVEKAITSETKAIVPVHYAGVGCEMDAIVEIAERYELLVIEDAAHAIGAKYRDRPLGSIGHLAAVSFHETKNVIAGEGGALLVNDPAFAERAEIVWEKGTNRAQFFRGEADKYTWRDIGSSYLPSDIIGAFLYAQLEEIEPITRQRLATWNNYYEKFEALETSGGLRRPVIPEHCTQNGHLFYLLLESLEQRTHAIKELAEQQIQIIFHYVPLHSSDAGRRFGRAAGDLHNTEELADRVVRLPLWIGMGDPEIDAVVGSLERCLAKSVAG